MEQTKTDVFGKCILCDATRKLECCKACSYDVMLKVSSRLMETPQFQEILFKIDNLTAEIKQLRAELSQSKIKPKGNSVDYYF